MDNFAVLTNRKRAIIALAHSVVFLIIACVNSLRPMEPLHMSRHSTGAFALLLVYAGVSAILCVLFVISRCTRERLYFALCTASAVTALVRMIVGDRVMHGSQFLRVLALTCAVVVATAIVRNYSPEPVLASD